MSTTHRSTAPASTAAAGRTHASTALRDALVLALSLSAGATDALCYLALDGKFSAFMTGNLVFLGLGISDATGPPLHTIIAPICGFMVGVLFASLILHPVRGSQLWPRRVTPMLVITVLGHLAFFSLWLAVSGHPSIALEDVLLAVSALGMGAQTAAVLALGIQGVFTTAATATLTVLMGNSAHWSTARAEDQRVRAGVLVALIVGATLGGVLVVNARSWAPLLPLLTTVTVVVLAAIGFKDQPARRTH